MSDFTCAHCLKEIDINHHELWELYEEETHYIECPYCNKELAVTASAVYSFKATDPEEDYL